MSEYGKPAPFRVGEKVNLAKSTDVLAGVCVESANVVKGASSSRQEHLKKDRHTYRYKVISHAHTAMKEYSKRKNKKDKPAFGCRVLDFLVNIYIGICGLRDDVIGFLLFCMLILTVIDWVILSDVLATFLGEGAGRHWAAIILLAWTVVKLMLPSVLCVIVDAFEDKNEQTKEIAKKLAKKLEDM